MIYDLIDVWEITRKFWTAEKFITNSQLIL